MQDRLIEDTVEARLKVAQLIRLHRPRWVFATTHCAVHPDHRALSTIAEGAVFYARLPKWDQVPGGESLAATDPWEIGRLFFYYCRMEPGWDRFDFAVDVTAQYQKKKEAVAAYEAVFSGRQAGFTDRVESADRYFGSLVGVEYAEIFRCRSPLLVNDLAAVGNARFG
jgi:LmbE family N-acetylglucosaminyl deacetylase